MAAPTPIAAYIAQLESVTSVTILPACMKRLICAGWMEGRALRCGAAIR